MASFDENGKYIKTNWKAGDKITATKLNKIEESIEAVNDNDISRHVEADARLDALEAKDVAQDKELTKVKNLIEDAKDAAELGDYEINSRMTFLENELNEGIEEVHNVASTVDGKIATAEANITAQVNTAKEEITAQTNQYMTELEAKIDEHDLDTFVKKIDESEVFIGPKGLSLNEAAANDKSSYENMFDSKLITPGYFMQSNGTLTTSTSNWISQKMNVENVKIVIVDNFTTRPTRLNEYDKEGNFIKQTNKTQHNLSVELNANTEYIVLGSHNEALDNIRMHYVYKNAEYQFNEKTYTTINEPSFNNKSISVEDFYFTDSYTKTKYWITHIPRYDAYGNVNELKLGFANNMINGDIFPETARSFANRNNATICINAGVSWDAYGGNVYYNKDGQKCNKMHGLRVYDHMLVSNDIESNWYKKSHWALGITDEGLLVSFADSDENGDTTMSYEQSQALGCKFVTSAFTPIMLNGVSQKDIIEFKNQWIKEDGSDVYYQRQIIGQNSSNKDIFILTSNGKSTAKNTDGLYIDAGMTIDNCISILKKFGCDFAYQLDEGGSTSLIYKGMFVNDKTDDSGKKERLLSDFLYVANEPLNDRDKDIKDLQKEIGEIKSKMGVYSKIFMEGEADSTREIQRWVNGTLVNSLNLKDWAVQYYRNKDSKTIFQADTNGFITTTLGLHGFFPKTIPNIMSEHFPSYSTCFLYPANVANAPFTVTSFVIHLVADGGGMLQIAIPYTSTAGVDLYPKWRVYMSDTWKAWNSFIK